jgi:hypothetical protein
MLLLCRLLLAAADCCWLLLAAHCCVLPTAARCASLATLTQVEAPFMADVNQMFRLQHMSMSVQQNGRCARASDERVRPAQHCAPLCDKRSAPLLSHSGHPTYHIAYSTLTFLSLARSDI